MGVPLLAGSLVEYVMYIADSVMVGRLGTDHLAAVAIGGMVSEILWAFTWTVAAAVQTFVSQRYGRQTAEGIDDPAVLRNSTAEAARIGVIFGAAAGFAALAVSFLSRPVISILLDDQQTIRLSMEYVGVLRWSMVPAAVFFALYGFLSGLGKTRTLMIATIITNIFNIIANYLLIYGKFFFPRLEIRGAALGTLFAQCLGLIFLTLVILSRRELREYRIFRLLKPKASEDRIGLFSGIFKAWLPVTVQNIGAFCVFLVYEGLVSRFGTVHLAVIHIVFLLIWAGKSISGGIAQGGSILVGNNLGRGDKAAAQVYVLACLILGVVTGLALAAAGLLFPKALLAPFRPETETLLHGIKALRFFAPFMFVGTAAYSLEVIFTFNGRGALVLGADLLSHGLFTLAFSWTAVLFFHGGILVVWTGYALYLASFSLLLFAVFLSGKWIGREIVKPPEDKQAVPSSPED